MKSNKIPKQGTTLTRKDFWDTVLDIVGSQKKVEGRNVKVNEFDGYGTIISVVRERGAQGACCVGADCSITTEEGCAALGGTWQGAGTTCDPNPCEGVATGACCNLDTFDCTDGVTHDDCVASGGIYLGDGSTCTETTCECCPALDHWSTITFSGEIIGCTGGTLTLPTKTFTKVAGPPGCDLALYEWANDANCGCQFQAQNCIPFTEAGDIDIDLTGSCDDPNYGSCLLEATIDCATGTLQLSGVTNTTCCPGGSNAQDTTFHGPYDFTSGSVDVTYASDSNPSISFHYTITFS